MARFCTNCGRMLNENARFCPECGVQLKHVTAPSEQPPVTENEYTQSFEVQAPEHEEAKEIPLQPVEEEPAVFCAAEHERQEQPQQPVQREQPVQPAFECRKEENTAWISSVMSYFGLMLLFSIPVVGWIACIIMSFTLKNKNTRNFARAALIFIVVCLLILCMLTAAGIALWNEIITALEEEYGIRFSTVVPYFQSVLNAVAF